VASKIEKRYVQGRTKAGGWSQQRYARRRDNQERQVVASAADVAATILLPRVSDLDAVVTGGDAALVSTVLADVRLAPLRPLVHARVHPVPDPRLAVLRAFPDQFLGLPIHLNAQA
jgi:Actinobacteria/chloroflexi VLRF1 release factor